MNTKRYKRKRATIYVKATPKSKPESTEDIFYQTVTCMRGVSYSLKRPKSQDEK